MLNGIAIVKKLNALSLALLLGATAEARPLQPTDFAQEKTAAPAVYVAPNEFDNYLQFRESARAPGAGLSAVVAVGTFRAFNSLGVLERDVLIAFDYAPGIAEFNQALARLITRYDRRQLIALLAGIAPGAIAEGAGERESLHRHLLERRTAKADFATMLAESGATARAETDPELRLVHEHLLQVSRGGKNHWLNGLIEYASTPERFTATIFGNERAYGHARAVVEGGRFFAITGSLSGALALPKIGETLRAQGILVSEFDISNALEHVLRNEGAKGMDAFAKNLASLPTRASSKVLVTGYLRTTDHGDIRAHLPSVGWWAYGTFAFNKFARAMTGIKTEPALFQAYGRLAPKQCRRLFTPSVN